MIAGADSRETPQKEAAWDEGERGRALREGSTSEAEPRRNKGYILKI